MSTNYSTTVLEWLTASTKLLTATSETPRLDCLVMLEDVLEVDRANLLAQPERKLKAEQVKKLNHQLELRSKHQPLAYIRQKIGFYGRDFFVDKRVLVPRPESEAIIDELIELKLPPKTVIADIGTGSGVLGITAALEVPESTVDLYDISLDALAVAKQNARSFSLNMNIEVGSLLGSLIRTPQVVLANLPYVPDSYPVNQATSYEPRVAIYAGTDGMSFYRQFWEQLASRGIKFVITESLTSQHAEQSKLANNAGYKALKTNGLVQLFKEA